MSGVWESMSYLHWGDSDDKYNIVLGLLPLGTGLDVTICIVFFLWKNNHFLIMFQVEKEDVWREKEDRCTCIQKTSTVVMVSLALRYIRDFYFKTQVEIGSCPMPVFPLSVVNNSSFVEQIPNTVNVSWHFTSYLSPTPLNIVLKFCLVLCSVIGSSWSWDCSGL